MFTRDNNYWKYFKYDKTCFVKRSKRIRTCLKSMLWLVETCFNFVETSFATWPILLKHIQQPFNLIGSFKTVLNRTWTRLNVLTTRLSMFKKKTRLNMLKNLKNEFKLVRIDFWIWRKLVRNIVWKHDRAPRGNILKHA